MSSRWSSVHYPPLLPTHHENFQDLLCFINLSPSSDTLLYQNFYPSGLLVLLIESLVAKIYLHFKKKYFLNVKWKLILVK